MNKNIYKVFKSDQDVSVFTDPEHWQNKKHIEIKHYLWMNNGYTPKVYAKLFYSDNYIYVFFNVFEKIIRIQYTKCGDPVYKDSCVEFFINPFPQKSQDYFNFEINAVGAMLVGVGNTGHDDQRKVYSEEELQDFEIFTSVKKPVSGQYGADNWTLYYKIPVKLFENYYKLPFEAEPAIGNFYKCGDETEFEHYGAWNPVQNKTPNFHMPRYFGIIEFER
ncbi:hypothetical protein JXQ31_17065 [candidate division KSB1 bacterium]|nr:hypothetical protein [candidate division KSB1 bacterium]